MKTRQLTLLIFLQAIATTVAHAQSLPNKQQVSVRAPADIKIDGKTTEWNDQFKAHNYGNHIYYTLSNDDSNLYLTARMDDLIGDRKVFKGGLTFTIIPLAKKANKLSVTFPIVSNKKRFEMEDGGGIHFILYRELASDTVANKEKIDSLIATSNREIKKDYKEIQVTGIPEINGTFLSIYNTQGIMVAASFDKKMRYTYELAIPLKYLEGAINDVKSIRYNIRLNVLPIVTATSSVQHDDHVVFPSSPVPVSIDDMFSYNDTDFSGEYTLAKK